MMPHPCDVIQMAADQNGHYRNKTIRFPDDLLADIEKSVRKNRAGSKISIWVREACEQRLERERRALAAASGKSS
jgi:hypothetical protein